MNQPQPDMHLEMTLAPDNSSDSPGLPLFYIASFARGDIFLPIHRCLPASNPGVEKMSLVSFSRSCLILVSITIFIGLPCLAQETDEQPARRPRIGIALGGGGARGAAHVGVLQILEELNVPIDYVSGTSMGSIVGALYAIGLSPDKIEQAMLAVDWDDLFSDRPERVKRTYRRKQDDTSFFLPVEFGIKGKGLVFSSGIIAGQKLGFAFPNPYLYLGGWNGFDNLAYPYRPVATDLSTGEMVVMDRGNLLKAVRASMSIPGVFPPVEWNGKYLVDGYLARNLPVDVVRDMGADIVIAVDVGTLPTETNPDQFQSLIGVSEQTGFIQARQNVDVQLPQADVVIHVDLGGISSRDFKRVPDTIPLGREAALAVAEELRKYSVSSEEYIEHLQRHRPLPMGMLIIDDIHLINNSQVDDRSILRYISQEKGRPLDLEKLKEDLGKVFDFGVFELVDFEITKNEAGSTTLTIIANDKYYAPSVVNIGLSYSGGSEGRSYIDARVRSTRLELNRFGSEVRSDFQLGRTNGIKSEYYQPLTYARRPFLSVAGRWLNQYKDWYIDQINLGDFKKEDVTGYLDLGYRLGHYGEFRVGLEYGHMQAGDKTNLNIYEFKGPRGGYTAALNLDMLDAAVFPRNGYRLRTRGFFGKEGFGSDLEYSKVEAMGWLVKTWSEQSFLLQLRGGSNLGTEIPEFDLFTMGGPDLLEGYRPDQFRGQTYGHAALGWYTKIKGHPSPYSTSWYVGARLEAGNAWREAENATWNDLLYCGSVTIALQTLIGPFSATYARSEDGKDAISLRLGNLVPFFD